ncbi:MAG TPA: Gfo/Idh/MocA family oxidoreductase [Tepidisphaeraceae bacterium]|nr:Gfo/Idh/MocA family oxidoreductase [Tepidisphaeraceae bacterium]
MALNQRRPQAQKVIRRRFLGDAAFIGMSAWLAGRGAWADETSPQISRSKNERLAFACIGIGGKGDGDSLHVSHFGDVVAICDIDDRLLERKSRQPGFERAERFNDYRQMFDRLGKSIDAVTVSTPDHHHAIAAMMAIRLGKHVYCQKPLTRTVHECRALREAARKYNVCTQMGNQGTATNEFRRSVEILRAEALGPVREVHVWTNRPIWPQAPTVMSRPPEAPVPAGVHWDQWIGPAPMRPYAEYDMGNGRKVGAYHQENWRGYWDFGTGAIGDMGCHTANLPFMGLDLDYPTSIEARCGDLNDETYPSWATIVYQFPARGERPPVRLTWWEGHRPDSRDPRKRNLPGPRITRNFDLRDSGALIIGPRAMMISHSDYGADQKIIFGADAEGVTINVPQSMSRLAEPGRPFDSDEAQKGEWVSAIRAGDYRKATANFDYAGLLAETILLGDVAIKAATKLEWDGPAMRITNNPEANKLLTREYRAGWTL